MTQGRFTLCGLCGKPLDAEHPQRGRQQLARKEGLVVLVGFSRGGWGQRQNAVDFGDEVCGECFDAVVAKVDEVVEVMDTLRGNGTPTKRGGLLRRLLNQPMGAKA